MYKHKMFHSLQKLIATLIVDDQNQLSNPFKSGTFLYIITIPSTLGQPSFNTMLAFITR